MPDSRLRFQPTPSTTIAVASTGAEPAPPAARPQPTISVTPATAAAGGATEGWS